MRGNNFCITGNVTRVNGVRRTASGTNVLSWGIAWNKPRRGQDGDYSEEAHFFDCTCFCTDAQLPHVERKLVAGARCSITEAHVERRGYTDREGNKRVGTSVVVDDCIAGLVFVPPMQRASMGCGPCADDDARALRGQGPVPEDAYGDVPF